MSASSKKSSKRARSPSPGDRNVKPRYETPELERERSWSPDESPPSPEDAKVKETFGVEFEMLLEFQHALEKYDSSPRPDKMVHFRQYCEKAYGMQYQDDDWLEWREDRDEWQDFDAKSKLKNPAGDLLERGIIGPQHSGFYPKLCASIWICDALRTAGIPCRPSWVGDDTQLLDSSFMGSLTDADRHSGWIVTWDESICPPLEDRNDPERHFYHALELVSPPLLAVRDNKRMVAKVTRLLAKYAKPQVNLSCGFHVHVGNGKDGFSIDQLKALYMTLWTYEDLIQEIIPGYRLMLGEGWGQGTARPGKEDKYDKEHMCKPLRVGTSEHFYKNHSHGHTIRTPQLSATCLVVRDREWAADARYISEGLKKIYEYTDPTEMFHELFEARDDNMDVEEEFEDARKRSAYNMTNVFNPDGKKTVEFRQQPSTLRPQTVEMWTDFCTRLVRYTNSKANKKGLAKLYRKYSGLLEGNGTPRLFKGDEDDLENMDAGLFEVIGFPERHQTEWRYLQSQNMRDKQSRDFVKDNDEMGRMGYYDDERGYNRPAAPGFNWDEPLPGESLSGSGESNNDSGSNSGGSSGSQGGSQNGNGSGGSNNGNGANNGGNSSSQGRGPPGPDDIVQSIE